MAGACGPGAAPVFCWVVLAPASRARAGMAPVLITGRDSGPHYGAHQYSLAAARGTIGCGFVARSRDSVRVGWRPGIRDVWLGRPYERARAAGRPRRGVDGPAQRTWRP